MNKIKLTSTKRIYGMSTLLFYLCLMLAGAIVHTPSSLAQTQQEQQFMGIIAVVNDEPISAFDLSSRLDLIISSSDLADRPEVRQRLVPQVLQTLVNEKLQLQEAERAGIQVTEEEIQQAFRALEQQNDIPQGQLEEVLTEQGLHVSSLRQQVKSTIAWRRLVSRKSGPLATVSEEEIDEAMSDVRGDSTITQYRFAEIFLPVENVEDEEQVAQSAQELFQQLQAGASFSRLARLFSESPSSEKGGGVDWTSRKDLDEEVREVLDNLEVGFLAEPVRVSSGYIILLLIDKRELSSDKGTLPSREQVAQSLQQEKLRRVARKYANDLRRAAIIEMRIGNN